MLKIKGLDELQQKLGDLAKKAKALDGQHSVPVSELLTDNFISRNTSFSSTEEMFKASGFKIETEEDFAAIPDAEWDNFIRSVSSFDGWQSMLGAAGQEWAKRQIGLWAPGAQPIIQVDLREKPRRPLNSDVKPQEGHDGPNVSGA